jgi:hypothetical protein
MAPDSEPGRFLLATLTMLTVIRPRGWQDGSGAGVI